MSRIIRRGLLSVTLCIILVFGSICSTYAATSAVNLVILSDYSKIMDIGDEAYLIALSTSGRRPVFRSSKSSVASVSPYGRIIAKKAGNTIIKVTCAGVTARCYVTVRKTSVSLNHTGLSLERGEKVRLKATTSNGSKVTWKVNRKSIVSINSNGVITSLKPGEATITATADKYSATCKITVRKPVVKLNMTRVTLDPGQSYKLTATVSSDIAPVWKSSRRSIVVISDEGTLFAIKSGVSIISAKVDGVEKTCIVTVR